MKSKDTFPTRPLVGEMWGEKIYHEKASEVAMSPREIRLLLEEEDDEHFLKSLKVWEICGRSPQDTDGCRIWGRGGSWG